MATKGDPNLERIMDELDSRYSRFVDRNTAVIIQQAKSTPPDQELPYVPVFDNFLQNGFTSYLKAELRKKGRPIKIIKNVIETYQDRFFYVTLPILLCENYFKTNGKEEPHLKIN